MNSKADRGGAIAAVIAQSFANGMSMTNDDLAPKSLAGQLAAYGHRLSLDQVPDDVLDHARYLLVDLIGAALAGVDTREAMAAVRAVRKMALAGGPCTIWGRQRRTAPTGAALVNGIAAHARELDDFGGVDHTGAVVVPALLAVGEAWPVVSGKRLLEAMIFGYEVGRRVLDACGGYRPHNHVDGWHSTGTCGSFAAAAAVSKALGLDVRESTWALGLAGSFTGGTWAFTRDGAMSKRYHAGRAAETGVTAVCLAQSGFTGPAAIFEAPWGGFLGTYARAAPAPAELVRGLGERYGIMRSGIKPYAACRDIHSSLDVILQARRVHHLGPDDIARIEVRCIPEMIQMVGQVATPQTRLEAQLSLPYSIAVALVTGRATLAEYEAPFLDDPAVRRLARRVVLLAAPDLPPDSEPHLVITTTEGRQIQGHVAYASGAPQNPLPPEVIVHKFETLAARVLPHDRVQALKEDVLALETLPDVRRITRHLRTVGPGKLS